MNSGEYGQVLRFNVKEDISSATTLEVILRDPEREESTVTATLGVLEVTTDIGTFSANEYVEYTLQDGDIDDDGWWFARAVITFADKKLKSDWQQFRVRP